MHKPALIALALLATPAAADTNLLINGDFSGGTYTSTIGGYTSQAPIGWDVTFGWDYAQNGYSKVSCNGGLGPGCYAWLANLGSDPVAGISQTFSDLPGSIYQVSFLLNLHGLGVFLQASINGVPQLTFYSGPFNDIFINGVDVGFGINGTETFTFVGTGFDTLSFDGYDNTNAMGITDVVINAVPEPSTWALMLIGFAGLGFVAYRRKRNAVLVGAEGTSLRRRVCDACDGGDALAYRGPIFKLNEQHALWKNASHASRVTLIASAFGTLALVLCHGRQLASPCGS